MEINREEKIDYIYETLKKQESRYKRAIYYKWAFRILMVWYLYYFIIVALPGYVDMFKGLTNPDIKWKITNSIKDIDKQELINKFKWLLNK